MKKFSPDTINCVLIVGNSELCSSLDMAFEEGEERLGNPSSTTFFEDVEDFFPEDYFNNG